MIGSAKIPPRSNIRQGQGVEQRVVRAMTAPLSPPRLLPSGDSAITVEFSRSIDDEANRRVLALDRTLTREPVADRKSVV